jgi:hypothetical protein
MFLKLLFPGFEWGLESLASLGCTEVGLLEQLNNTKDNMRGSWPASALFEKVNHGDLLKRL